MVPLGAARMFLCDLVTAVLHRDNTPLNSVKTVKEF